MASSTRQPLTRRQKRKRVILLALLLLLLALLSYATFYFVRNQSLPSVKLGEPQAALTAPQYLFSITGDEGKGQIRRPAGVDIGADGRVYVVDAGNRRMSVFAPRGRYLFSFGTTGKGRLRSPVNVAIKGSEVWVTERRFRTIYVYDLEGKYLRTFTPEGEPKFSWAPLAISFDTSGAPRVTDVGATDRHRVIFFSTEGSRTVTFGKTVQANSVIDSPSEFFFPSGIAVAKNGAVYVSDSNNRRIQVFKPTGELIRIIDSSGIPRGLAVDSKHLFAVDALAHVVDIYDLDGKQLVQFGSKGFGPSQFNYPADVALDKNGRIYVTDRENDQVQVWGWPVAPIPRVVTPSTPWGWALCLLPLLLLLIPLMLRKVRLVVSPEFVEVLIQRDVIAEVASKRKLRLLCPEMDHALYAGRIVGDVDLGTLIQAEEYSESDVRAMREKLDIGEREAILLALADRARGLCTEDLDLRRLARLAEIGTFDAEQFIARYFGANDRQNER